MKDRDIERKKRRKNIYLEYEEEKNRLKILD